MGISIIKKNIDEFLTGKIFIMIITFSIVGGNSLRKVKAVNLTYWEYIIDVMADQYYILYFMIVFFLLAIFKLVYDDEKIILIRTGRYINYFIVQVVSLLFISVIFVLLHIFIVGIAGYGLKMDNMFTENVNYYNNFKAIGSYGELFKTPMVAIFFHIIYMILGLTFIGVILMVISHYCNKKVVIICMVCMYLLMIIGLKTDIDKSFPFVFMNNYVILHHVMTVFKGKFYFMILSEMFFTSCILFIIKKFWYTKIIRGKNSSFKIGVNKWYLQILFSRKNISIMITLIIVFIINILLRYDALTINDFIMLQFYGHGIGYLNIMDFINLIIYNGIPIYIIAYFLEKERKDRSLFATIRLKNKKQWFISVMSSGFLLIFIYVLTSLCITVIICICLGMECNGYNYMNHLFIENGLKIISPYYLYAMILTSKVLELFFYFLILIICYIYTRGATLGFLVIQFGYLSYFLKGNVVKYTPVGIGSLARMAECIGNQGISYLHIMVILMTINIVLYLYLRCGIYKRNFN